MTEQISPVVGCDDAPVEEVPLGDRPKTVAMIVPYYENPETLAVRMIQWLRWRADEGLRNFSELILVDDGSPEYPAEAVLKCIAYPFPISLFRIDVDIRWNWIAARNLGFHMARKHSWKQTWCLVTDIDHAVPGQTMTNLIYGQHDPETIYRLSREERGAEIHPHPNSWFMTREMFWRIGGYDEALSGHYGTDRDFRQRAAATAPIKILPERLVREEHVRDSSTTRYLRKQPEDEAAVKDLIAQRGPDWSPRTLAVPWHEVSVARERTVT